jgi:hypothetical protein
LSPTKSAILNLRIDPGLKEALRIAANRQHRSVSNMLEWLIRDHCRREEISIPEQAQMDLEPRNG